MYENMLFRIFIEHSDPTFTVFVGKIIKNIDLYTPVAPGCMN